MRQKCRGIIPVMLTAMRKDETIDYSALRGNVETLIAAGVDGLFVLGTNGEFYALTEDEKFRVAETVIDQTAGRVPVYVGVGDPGTRTTIERARRMLRLKPFALTVVTPYFVAPSQKDLREHFRRVALETGAPLLLYNIPGRTGVSLAPETLGRLAEECENIIGVKDSSGDMQTLLGYLKAAPQIGVLCGNDGLILEALRQGATGAVAATANVAPHVVVGLYRAFLAGDYRRAEAYQQRLCPLRQDFAMGAVPGILKAQANLAGMKVGPSRAPVLPPDEQVRARLLETLKASFPELYEREAMA